LDDKGGASAIATGLVVWLLMRRVNWYFLAYVAAMSTLLVLVALQ